MKVIRHTAEQTILDKMLISLSLRARQSSTFAMLSIKSGLPTSAESSNCEVCSQRHFIGITVRRSASTLHRRRQNCAYTSDYRGSEGESGSGANSIPSVPGTRSDFASATVPGGLAAGELPGVLLVGSGRYN